MTDADEDLTTRILSTSNNIYWEVPLLKLNWIAAAYDPYNAATTGDWSRERQYGANLATKSKC